MCLYPRLYINKKYRHTKKNNGNIPTLKDSRVQYVPVGCGNCIECRKQKAREWQIRLNEELKTHKYAYFVTLTFSPDSLNKLCKTYNLKESNAVAGKAVRLFLERIRKEYKKSITHWLITELGQNNTERIHLHGIIFTEFKIDNEWLLKFWKYGMCDNGKYVNLRTINYIIKYITKIDILHKNFKPQIFCSKGIGKGYINDESKRKHRFNGTKTKDFYTLPNGIKLALPIYYRNKFFSEEEREMLWINKIEQDTRYVLGIEIKNTLKSNFDKYLNILRTAQEKNISLGYGDFTNEWKKTDYNITLEMIKKGYLTST